MSRVITFLENAFARSGGEMPFDRYMDLALYAPGIGYYSTHVGEVGRRGDFSTAATLSTGLAKAIRQWLGEEARFSDWKNPVPAIEVGAGTGALAREILRSPFPFRKRPLVYHIVEVSDPLRKIQRRTLSRFGDQIQWHSSMAEALGASGGKALIFSNELIDAFPAKWMRWNGDGNTWEEIYVCFDLETGISETFRAIEPAEEYPEFSSFLESPVPLQRIEIQPSVRDWLEDWAPHWIEGALLTVDYGGSPERIYHRRPGGTMRGYFKHERIEGSRVYGRFGKQDLTVDVNFTDLRHWGEALGWKTVSLETQAAFLEKMGRSGDPMAEGETGEAFQVLHQRKL